MRIIGIDPGGVNASYAIFDEDTLIAVDDFTVTGEGARRYIDPRIAAAVFETWKPIRAIIERVSAMPKQGVSSSFKFGYGAGMLTGIAACYGCSLKYVTPQAWKKFHGLSGSSGDASRQKAIQLVPLISGALSRVKDHGRAEAILIGLYGAAKW